MICLILCHLDDVLILSVIDHGFDTRSGQTKDY